ncbi:hypothetical protein, partial [Streptomyces sp. ISL-86]|uniref:hypothetical protein n=1 Tax=Streptomyces sp. ISL-86 TaxID=2819187 RepID=UPI001BEA89E8
RTLQSPWLTPCTAPTAAAAASSSCSATSARIPPPSDIAAIVFEPENGVTATKKDFTRAALLAAAANALPYGTGPDVRELEHLVDHVLRVEGYAVALPHIGSTVMSSTDRYTTRDTLTSPSPRPERGSATTPCA